MAKNKLRYSKVKKCVCPKIFGYTYYPLLSAALYNSWYKNFGIRLSMKRRGALRFQ